MKRIISISLTLILVFSMSFFTFAAKPKAAACGVCRSGKMLTVTKIEPETVTWACKHGYGGGAYDLTHYDYQNTYYQCNVCKVGQRIGHVYLKTTIYCEGSGSWAQG